MGKQILALFVFMLIVLGYGGFVLYNSLHKEEMIVKTFEELSPPLIPLGYGGRGSFYTTQNEIKQDIARLYNFEPPIEANHVGLRGVWFVERDKITSLSDGSSLTIPFRAAKVSAFIYGDSSLPVRIELDGTILKDLRIEGANSYTIAQIPGEVSAHQLTLYVPRGISLTTLSFSE